MNHRVAVKPMEFLGNCTVCDGPVYWDFDNETCVMPRCCKHCYDNLPKTERVERLKFEYGLDYLPF